MSIDILQFRQADERQWEVPLLATDLPAGVMPLFANNDDELHHVGTAFLISQAGLIATASHCITYALGLHGFRPEEFEAGEEYDLLQTRVKLSVLHIHVNGEQAQMSIWSVANAQIAHPTDLAFGCLHDVDAPAMRALPTLSFRVPAPDSWVQVVGSRNNLPPISMKMVRERSFDWRAYQPTLMGAVGQVRATLLFGYEPLTKGPSILTDCPSVPGMSGGPVISEGGVCAVVSSNAVLPDGENGSVLSLLHAALPVPLNLVLNLHENCRIESRLPLIEAIERGLIRSDGTHRMHRIVEDGGLFRVDPLIDREHSPRVFNNRQDFSDGHPSQQSSPDTSPM